MPRMVLGPLGCFPCLGNSKAATNCYWNKLNPLGWPGGSFPGGGYSRWIAFSDKLNAHSHTMKNNKAILRIRIRIRLQLTLVFFIHVQLWGIEKILNTCIYFFKCLGPSCAHKYMDVYCWGFISSSSNLQTV